MCNYIDPEIKWPESLKFISGDFVIKHLNNCYYKDSRKSIFWVDENRKVRYCVTNGYEVTGILAKYKYV